MPSIPLKSSSASGGRLRRLLASLRPPARAGPLPVQTGFPTSLADIVVKNHGRLRNPRRRHRAPAAAAPPPAAAAEPMPVPQSQERRDLSAAHVAAAAATVTARPGKGAGFSIRPGLLVAGGAMALALLVIWSKQLVAAATLASVALSWIESSLCSPVADSGDLGSDESSSSVNNPKQSRRSLRKLKLLANKLRNGKTPQATDSRHGGEAGEYENPETPRRLNAEPAAAAAAPAEATPAPPPEALSDDDRCCRRRRGALPLPALVPIILAGLIAGKLPALTLAVLCAPFSSSVERVPAGQASR